MAYNTKNIIRDAAGAPIPQFYDPTSDAYQPLTGVDLGGGRYGYDNLAWGKTAGGLYVPLKVADDGTVLTQLTGRKVEYISVFNALALTDTTEKLSAVIDLKLYKPGVTFFVYNTLDQSVTIELRHEGTIVGVCNKVYYYDSSTWKGTGVIIPNTNYCPYVLNNVPGFNLLNTNQLGRIVFRAICSVAPTTGALTLFGVGGV